jgi:flagellar biosynthesis component FlhA
MIFANMLFIHSKSLKYICLGYIGYFCVSVAVQFYSLFITTDKKEKKEKKEQKEKKKQKEKKIEDKNKKKVKAATKIISVSSQTFA